MKEYSLKNQKGQVILIGIVFFAALMLFSTALMTYISVNMKSEHQAIARAKALQLAEAGIDKAAYELNEDPSYTGEDNTALGDGTFSISVSSIDSTHKRITSIGSVPYSGGRTAVRIVKATLVIDRDEVAFNYGVQAGEGGVNMSNNSRIGGSLYSNGSVSGGNGAIITGDVWVASNVGNIDQQSVANNASFIFGKTSPIIDSAQSFTPSVSGNLTKVSLLMKKSGLPSDKTIRILTDSGGKPSKTLVSSGAYGTLNASQVSASDYSWVDVALNIPPALSAGAKYWIVVDTSPDSSNYFFWGEDSSDSYSGGTGMYSENWNAKSPVWNSVGGDLAFKVWMGGDLNSLTNVDVGGDAHANTISGCDITGDAYYQTISGSTVGGTQYPGSADPAMENMPISDGNISDWKSAAEGGGIIEGDYEVSGTTAALGPKKINGSLSVTNGADLTITGTVYVTGTINISNNAIVRLGENYGDSSGVVLSDGSISISNNVVFYANGSGTYLLFLSTASGDAIDIANNSNTVIFYASDGTIDVSNNAVLKEATGYAISLSNGAQIIYESGLASTKFSSGPGASWAYSPGSYFIQQ